MNDARELRSVLAENGNDGVLMALEHIPDLAIVDVMMPDMSGYEG